MKDDHQNPPTIVAASVSLAVSIVAASVSLAASIVAASVSLAV